MKSIPIVAVSLFLAGVAQAAECPAEYAAYEMASGDGARLALEKRAEPAGYPDLEIVVRPDGNARRFTFYLTASNGYGNIYAIPDDEAVSENGLITFFFRREGERLASSPELPSSGEEAPDAIFLPMIGSDLWYATNGTENPVMIPTEIWYFAGCRQP